MAGEPRSDWWRSIAGFMLLGVTAAVFYWMDLDQPKVDPAAAPADGSGSIMAFFTPPGDELMPGSLAPVEQAVLDSLQRAERSVDLAAYDFDLWRLRDELLDCQRRGVRVRVVVESDNADQPALLDLQGAGIPIVGDDRGPLMHHKFMVIDDELVWAGSMNFTQRGVYHNNNNFLRIESADVAADFSREFEEMFAEDRFGALSRADTPYPFLVVDDSAVEVAFSPEDDVQGRIIRRLNQASASVDLLAFTLTADPIADALIAAYGRGVHVRGVLEAARADDLGADAGRLRSAGLDLRLDTNPDTMHNKVMIIDRQTVVTGSYNFTQSAEEHNDENLLIIDNTRLAGQYGRAFQALFEAALP